MDLDYNQFIFGKTEQLESVKLNNLLHILEKQREFYGPYSASLKQPTTASGALINIEEAIDGYGYSIGYYYTLGADYILTRKFIIEYRSDVGTNAGYVRWEGVSGVWADNNYTITLGTGYIVYSVKEGSTSRDVGIGTAAGKVNLTGATIENFLVFPMNSQA